MVACRASVTKLLRPVKAVHQADPAGSNEGSKRDLSYLFIDFNTSTILCQMPNVYFFVLLTQAWATSSNECKPERSRPPYSTELHS